MLKLFGETQQRILRLLHRNGRGLTIDQLAKELDVTRTAVKQHLTSLTHDGFVAEGPTQDTGGRPVRTYLLSAAGQEVFQKQYSWFSELLLGAWKDDIGGKQLQEKLRALAKSIAQSFKTELQGKSADEKTAAIARIMNTLSYEAEPLKKGAGEGVQAWNCVYHRLAQQFPEVCGFDLALLEELSGQEIDHQECIIRGGNVCRFAFGAKK